jgi:NAD(P)-dependent dehydrogenase (short-subunit alcohol dehydrogenase family)
LPSTAHFLQPGGVVIVTGAAQGFGRAIAQRLAAQGARLALWDVQPAEDTARLCREAGGEVRVWQVDVGSDDQIIGASQEVEAAWGIPYALVNNAGIHPRAMALELETELWDRVLRVNLTGTFVCARTLGRRMVEAGKGIIVNTASGRALEGAVNGAAYAASKAGIANLTKTLALEWAPHDIRVNCVIPGVSDTAQPLEAPGETRESLLARGSRIPLGRIGQPEDVAGIISFLLGPDATYMTGQCVAVNGGAIMIP